MDDVTASWREIVVDPGNRYRSTTIEATYKTSVINGECAEMAFARAWLIVRKQLDMQRTVAHKIFTET